MEKICSDSWSFVRSMPIAHPAPQYVALLTIAGVRDGYTVTYIKNILKGRIASVMTVFRKSPFGSHFLWQIQRISIVIC